jgi:hypothetical protein
MSKIDLIKIIAFAILIILITGVLFFRKDSGTDSSTQTAQTPKNDSSQKQATPSAADNNTTVEDSLDPGTKQGKGVAAINEFVVAYNSYVYGDFSNIENLYPSMTDKMSQSEETKIKSLKSSVTQGQNITVESKLKDSQIESYDPNSGKMTLIATIEKSTYGGAYIHNQDYDSSGSGDENILIDRNGKEYGGPIDELLEKTETQVFRITAINESEEWKISDMQRIN